MSGRRRRSWLALALPFLGLVLGVVVLVNLVDVGAAVAAIASANPWWVLLGLALALNATVIVGAKLWVVVRIVDEPRTFAEAWSAVMAGVSLNAVIPGRGGDLVRAVFLAKTPGTLPVFLGAVLMERLFDLFTIGLLVLVVAPRLDLITLAAIGVCCAAVGGTVVLAWLGPNMPLRPDLGERVSRTASQALQRPGYSLLAMALSFATWVNNAAILVITLWAVGVTVPLVELYRASAVGILVGIIPISVSGIGTRDTALVLTLEPYGQGAAVAAGSLLFTALVYWFLALVGSLALGSETLKAARRAVERGAPVHSEADPAAEEPSAAEEPPAEGRP